MCRRFHISSCYSIYQWTWTLSNYYNQRTISNFMPRYQQHSIFIYFILLILLYREPSGDLGHSEWSTEWSLFCMDGFFFVIMQMLGNNHRTRVGRDPKTISFSGRNPQLKHTWQDSVNENLLHSTTVPFTAEQLLLSECFSPCSLRIFFQYNLNLNGVCISNS